MKTCINNLIVIESLTIVNLLNKVQFPFVKVFPPQMLSSSSEGAIVQAVPIAFAPVFKIDQNHCEKSIFLIFRNFIMNKEKSNFFSSVSFDLGDKISVFPYWRRTMF